MQRPPPPPLFLTFIYIVRFRGNDDVTRYVEARTKVQFKGTATPLTAGALYEETCTQFGVYNEGDWGCHSSIPRSVVSTAV